MKSQKLFALVSAAALLGALTLSCASQAPQAGGSDSEQSTLSLKTGGGSSSDSAPAAQAPQAPQAGGRNAVQGAPGPSGAGEPAQSGSITDRMIVYNTSISLAVDNVQESVNAVTALASGAGGIVSGTSIRYDDKKKEQATLTLRVPSTAYNQVMNDLRKLGAKVLNETGSTRDVTEEFTDLDAQLRNYQATEAQYLELLKQAKTIDEILKVQAQLTNMRGQIERTKGRMNLLERTADMGTIAVSLTPVTPSILQEPATGWDPAKTVRDAWEASLVFVRVFADASLRVLVFSWWLPPVGLLFWGIWTATRRRPREVVNPS